MYIGNVVLRVKVRNYSFGHELYMKYLCTHLIFAKSLKFIRLSSTVLSKVHSKWDPALP